MSSINGISLNIEIVNQDGDTAWHDVVAIYDQGVLDIRIPGEDGHINAMLDRELLEKALGLLEALAGDTEGDDDT
jgi:hypothetical protein